jgi:hypothetical protein
MACLKRSLGIEAHPMRRRRQSSFLTILKWLGWRVRIPSAIAGHFGSGDPDPLPIPFALEFYFSRPFHGGDRNFLGTLIWKGGGFPSIGIKEGSIYPPSEGKIQTLTALPHQSGIPPYWNDHPFLYADHIFNYLDYLRSFQFGKISGR